MEWNEKICNDVACFMQRLYQRGLTTASGGNISVLHENLIYITPSAVDKGSLRGNQVGIMDREGNNLTPHLKPSIESRMHLAIYSRRNDIQAIVHSHPPLASSFTAMDNQIDCTLIAEARAVLGTPVTAAYALMGTDNLAETVAEAASQIEKPHVILMKNHGIVCLGRTLLAAFDRTEVLECAARMTIVTRLMGGVRGLTTKQLKEIDNSFSF